MSEQFGANAGIESGHLPGLIQHGVLDDSAYMRALSFLRNAPLWQVWALNALLALAIGHVLSGIIFFFAFNWYDLAAMTKFAVVGGGIFASLIAWMIAGLDSPVGKSFGIAATVLVGVMFAVLGQVYQTPALIHTPFTFWALLTLPFALASRSLAHWAVWLVILSVAVSTYGNSTLRLSGADDSANVLNIAVALGFFAILCLKDYVLSPRMPWARAGWFRVLLVLGCTLFASAAYMEAFWSNGISGLNWVVALALMGGLLAYLYFLKPGLAALALATFSIFFAIAQWGFQIVDLSGDVPEFFLVFIWVAALLMAMVFLFRRFIERFEGQTGSGLASENARDEAVESQSDTVSVGRFASHMNLDATEIETVQNQAEPELPWYMSTFIALGGIFTAIFGCLFVGSFLALILSSLGEDIIGIVGFAIFAAAIFFRRKTDILYLRHMLNTLVAIGGILTIIGFAIQVDNFDAIIGVSIFLAMIVLLLLRDSILEFLSAAIIITLIGVELYHLKVPMAETIILVLATLPGIFFLTRPIGNRLFNAAGTALLIAPAILGIGLVHENRWDEIVDVSRFSDTIIPRLISLAVLAGSVIYLNRTRSIKSFIPDVRVLIPLIFAAAFLPLGGASGLLIILAGFILGSRSLAIIGTLLQIYFLTMFYYDLSLGLLTKSIILFFTGLVFLAVWFYSNRQATEQVA